MNILSPLTLPKCLSTLFLGCPFSHIECRALKDDMCKIKKCAAIDKKIYFVSSYSTQTRSSTIPISPASASCSSDKWINLSDHVGRLQNGAPSPEDAHRTLPVSHNPAVPLTVYISTCTSPWPDNWDAYGKNKCSSVPSLRSWQWGSRDGGRHYKETFLFGGKLCDPVHVL